MSTLYITGASAFFFAASLSRTLKAFANTEMRNTLSRSEQPDFTIACIDSFKDKFPSPYKCV